MILMPHVSNLPIACKPAKKNQHNKHNAPVKTSARRTGVNDGVVNNMHAHVKIAKAANV